MTCFWDGIIQALKKNKLMSHEILENTAFKKSSNARTLVELVKEKNRTCESVNWNNEKLSGKQMEENIEHIKNIDVGTIGQGYLCSSCEPVLVLICELFQVDIEHRYVRSPVSYRCDIGQGPKKLLRFNSSNSHFTCG